MEQALQGWRDSYQIEEEAYTQLCSLLQNFGIPIQFVHSAHRSHANRFLAESSTVDPILFSAGPTQSGTTSSRYSNEARFSNQVASAGPFESAIPNQGSSNQGPNVNIFGLGITDEGLSSEGHNANLFHMGTTSEESSSQGLRHWQNSNTRVYTTNLDFPAYTDIEFATESRQQGNSIASDRFCNTTAENFPSAALTASQSMPESSSRPRPCIRCWKRKLRVYLASLFQWSLADQWQCNPTNSGVCETCSKISIPPHVCTRVRFASEPIFSKCNSSNLRT